MVESIAKRRALPRGRFQVDRHAQILGSTVKLVDRKRDPPQTGLLACSPMSAGMDDQIPDTELVAPLHLDDHGLDRPVPECVVRAGKVDQVRTMRHGITDPGPLERLTERAGLLEGQGRGVPLVTVLGKYLHGLEAHVVRCHDRSLVAAGN